MASRDSGGGASRFEAILDPAGRIVAFTAGERWPPELAWAPLVGAALVDVIAAEDRQAVALALADPDGAALSVVLCVDGATVPAVLTLRWVGDYVIAEGDAQQPGGEGITPEQLAQHRLEEIGILSSGIAHDFNNILSAILGNAELLAETLPGLLPSDSDDLLAAVADVSTAATRSRELIGQMLGYAVKATPQRGLVDLSALTREMARLLRVSTPQSVVFDYALDPAPPRVDGDASQLRQVVMNLIVNAAEAIGDDVGSIGMRTGTLFADRALLDGAVGGAGLPEGDYLTLAVVDTGCGMNASTLERIFDPFFSTKRNGHGLGLAGVLSIVRSHGGAIEVRSTPGIGTTFQVLLPVAQRPHEAPVGAQLAAPVDLTGRTILVIDDEAIVRRVTRRILEVRGVRVLTAEDGLQGLELVLNDGDTIDAVLLDVSMPFVDGFEVYRELSAIRPELPVLLISGYSGAEIQRRAAGLGVAGFLQKPYGAAELAAELCRILGG